MARGRRKAHRPSRSRRPVVVAAVIAVIAAVGIGWAVVAPRTDTISRIVQVGPEPTSESKSPTAGQPDEATKKPVKKAIKAAEAPKPAERSGDVRAAARLRACSDAAAKGVAAVGRARSAFEGWSAHIQAMKDQEAGKNTAEQTKAIWTRTRTSGPGQVAAFKTADHAYAAVHDACDNVETADLSAEKRTGVDVCRTFAGTVDSTLAAARPTLAEWESHLSAMASRRAGTLDPDTAMARWMSAYEKAPFRISIFQKADQEYRQTKPCTLS